MFAHLACHLSLIIWSLCYSPLFLRDFFLWFIYFFFPFRTIFFYLACACMEFLEHPCTFKKKWSIQIQTFWEKGVVSIDASWITNLLTHFLTFVGHHVSAAHGLSGLPAPTKLNRYTRFFFMVKAHGKRPSSTYFLFWIFSAESSSLRTFFATISRSNM